MAKVPSIEEFMKVHRKAVKDRVEEYQKSLDLKLDKIKDQKMPDYSQLVQDKLDKDGLSYSGLKKFRESPITYIQYLQDQLAGEVKTTPAMFEGNVLDCMVTEPEEFNKRYFLVPEKIPNRSNEQKAINQLYMEFADKQAVLEPELFDKCIGMASAIWANEDAKIYLERMAKTQVKISYVHKPTGYKLRGILDGQSVREPEKFDPFILDLKKNKSADAGQFFRDAANLWYNGQVGNYTLWASMTGWWPDFIHVVVEPVKPYNVNVFRSAPGSKYMRQAQLEFHNTLLAFQHCHRNNWWHKSFDFIRDEQLNYEAMETPGYYKPKFM